ncbi:MAG: tyrosine-type recombinase/integrase [Akkermansiaceae bacterium]
MFQLYGLKGLKEGCEFALARLEAENKSIDLEKLLTIFKDEHWDNWSTRHRSGWNTLVSLLHKSRHLPLVTLDAQFWKDWLKTNTRKRSWSSRSYNSYIVRLSSVFNYAANHDYIQANPFLKITKKKIAKEEKSILTPAQVRSLLFTAWEHDLEMVPYFAIGIFAGPRPVSELEKLTWEDINFEEKWIRIQFGNKTDTKRFIPIEDSLMEWLKPWRNASGSIIPTNLTKRRRYIIRGKYQSPKNTKTKDWKPLADWSKRDIMRHTYGSYLDAKYRDRNMIKENMGHNDFKTYEQHYRNARTPNQSTEFWSILPPKSSESKIINMQAS